MTFYLSFFSIFFLTESLSILNDQTDSSISLSTHKIDCYDDLNIYLNNYSATVECGEKNDINYNDLSNYQFITYKNPIFFHKQNIDDNILKDKMGKIIQSLNLTQRKDVFLANFSNYENYNDLLSYIYFFQYDDLELWMIIKDDYENNTLYTCNEDNLNELEMIYSDSKWRLVCLKNEVMLHYNNNNETIEMILVPRNLTYIIVFSVILAFFVILISTYIIAKCKTKKSPVGNEQP